MHELRRRVQLLEDNSSRPVPVQDQHILDALGEHRLYGGVDFGGEQAFCLLEVLTAREGLVFERHHARHALEIRHHENSHRMSFPLAGSVTFRCSKIIHRASRRGKGFPGTDCDRTRKQAGV